MGDIHVISTFKWGRAIDTISDVLYIVTHRLLCDNIQGDHFL